MKNFKTTTVFSMLSFLCLFVFCAAASAQIRAPRASQRASISQTIGITDVTIVYHRPGIKGREGKIWGCESSDVIPIGGKTYPCLVPYNQVWRMGANEATTFEITDDVMINGQKLPKGKYSIHAIPTPTEWTIAFNKVADQWGSFRYDEKQDALRVKVKPEAVPTQEWLIYEFGDVTENDATVTLRWEKVKVSFKIDVGNSNANALNLARANLAQSNFQTANFIFNNKLKDQYEQALKLVEAAISIRETFNNLSLKARLLAELGNVKDAVAVGEKAIQVGKSAQPAANTTNFEQTVADWKKKTQ
jgi:hypothetical protein